MKRVRLHREGLGLLVSFFLMLTTACWATFVFVPFKGVFILTLLISITIMGLALNFFRFPKRSNNEASNRQVIVAPADGKLVVMEEVDEPELLGRRCLKLSIFMSLYNVHANWVACNGTIMHVEHQSGAYYKAFLPKSSVLNERSAVIIKTDDGHEVLERQIAGAVARRVVTYPKVGDNVGVHDFLGFIKFGSRIDLYLPLGTQISVQLGDEVQGGTTTLGYLPDRHTSC